MINKKLKKVAIIDYNAGNLFSVQHACSFIGLDSKITSNKKEILDADGAILPGVGAFGEAMDNLQKMGLIEPIKEFVASGKPFMGVCLGLQLLFSESEEFGLHKGLDLVKGRVIKFPAANNEGRIIKVPQIGWNQVVPPSNNQTRWDNSPLSNTVQGEFMYFVHSFFVKPTEPEDILSLTNYEGIEYCSSIQKNNIFATQFHPEKSAEEGIKIYQNWAKAIK